MTDGYGRDIDRVPIEVDKEDLLGASTPADLTDLMDGAVREATRKQEERLVRSLFAQIREHTVTEQDKEESRPNVSMHEEPPDLEDMEFEDWFVPAGCVRVDGKGEPLTVDLLYEAREAAEREGLYPENSGWEWWLHPYQLNNVRDDETWQHSVGGMGTWEEDEEYAHAFCGTPVRTWPAFPKGAALLLDVDVLVPEHAVGSRVPQGVLLKDPRRVVRITSLGVTD